MTYKTYIEKLTEYVDRPGSPPQPEGGKTYCNFAMAEIFSWFGLIYPTIIVPPPKRMGTTTERLMLANEFIDWLRENSIGKIADQKFIALGVVGDWPTVFKNLKMDEDPAKLVIAAQRGAEHGHLCPVIASDLVFSNKWKKLVPCVANVGRKNFIGKGLSWAFTTEPQIFIARL